MPIPIIALGLATLGTGLAVGVSQRRKMKRQLDEDRDTNFGAALREHDEERRETLTA